MHRQLKKLLKNLVSVQHGNGTRNSAGEAQYSSAIVYPGRVEYRTTTLTDKLGDEVYSKSRIYFDADVIVDEEDLITLPDGRTFPVLQIKILFDENGNVDHKVVFA